MKSPRITLSIALLLSLPARVYAADSGLPVGMPLAESSSQSSVVAYHLSTLAHASDSIMTHKDALNALVLLQNPKMHNSENELAILSTGDYSWQSIRVDGERPKYIVQAGDQIMACSSIIVPTAQEFHHQTLQQLDGVLVEHKAAILADLKSSRPQTSFDAATNYLWQRVEIDGKTTYVPLADGASLGADTHYQQALANAPEEILQTKETILATVALQNPKMHNSENELQLLKSGNYSWIPVKVEGARTTYIVQGNGVYIEEESSIEDPAASEESSSGWLSYLPSLPSLPTLFASASTSQDPVKAEFVPVLQGILQELDEALVLRKDNAVKAIPRAAYVYENGVATVPLNKGSQAGWHRSRTRRHEAIEKTKPVLAPNAARVEAYYTDAAVTTQMLQKGMVSAELAAFNKTTAERAIARQGSSQSDQQKLLDLVQSRRIRLEGTGVQQPGLKLLSALGAKTAEQRTKVLVQLRATESALTNELNTERARVFKALNQSTNYDLVFKLSALTSAIKDAAASEGVWSNSILQQFTQTTKGTSLAYLPLAAFAEGTTEVYNSWRTSYGEPTQATALRAETQIIPTIEAALADAKEKKIGHLIDRYTVELTQHKARQEELFAQLQDQVVEATRAVLLTDATLLDACTRIDQLQKPLATLKTVIADESNADLKPLASMLALLTADTREEGRVTRDAILGLLGSSGARTDLTRQKQNTKERTAFKVAPHDPDYYFVRDTLAPAVDAAAAELAKVAEEQPEASKPIEPQVEASSSSDAQPKAQPKPQPKKTKTNEWRTQGKRSKRK